MVNGSGVDLLRHCFEEYPGHREDGITRFLYVGRLMREKGTTEYLEAARLLHEKYGDRVSVAAIGYCEEEFAEELSKGEREGYFKLIPFNPVIHPFLKEADAVVMPSYHEGMSNVLLEASATGRPVLASDISGCKEIVEDGITGFKFKPRNTNALFDAMCRFMELPAESRRVMGQKAREKMEKEFDRRKITDAYMDEINMMFGTMSADDI